MNPGIRENIKPGSGNKLSENTDAHASFAVTLYLWKLITSSQNIKAARTK